ncbi:MAG: hypothetical protein AAGA50_14860 [Pseudomonadota bacterium]
MSENALTNFRAVAIQFNLLVFGQELDFGLGFTFKKEAADSAIWSLRACIAPLRRYEGNQTECRPIQEVDLAGGFVHGPEQVHFPRGEVLGILPLMELDIACKRATKVYSSLI